MSDRDQPDEELTDAPATGATSGTERNNGDRDDDLPSFDAYGDEENWSAFEDDESLGSDPEWTEDSDDRPAAVTYPKLCCIKQTPCWTPT